MHDLELSTQPDRLLSGHRIVVQQPSQVLPGPHLPGEYPFANI